MDEEIDTQGTDIPICPHCGTRDHQWWDGLPLTNDGGKSNVTCGTCGKDYILMLETTYSFDTAVPKTEDQADAEQI